MKVQKIEKNKNEIPTQSHSYRYDNIFYLKCQL